MQKYTPIQYVVYLLSRRDYSEQELRRKMAQKSYLENEIEEAIVKAQQHNWQSDARFCESYIRSRARAGYGPKRIKQELYMKGIAEWLVSQMLQEADIDWYEVAQNVFNKKKPRPPKQWDLKTKQKIWRFMLNHGFENDHFSDLIHLDY